MTTFFAPASRCFCAPSRSVKKPVDSSTTSTPRSPQGSAPGSRSREHAHLLAGGAEHPVGELDLALERAERRVVLQEVGHRLRVAEVVQRDDLEIGPERVPRAEEVPPDAAESVDADASSHPLLRFSVPVPARASLFGELFEPSQAAMDGDPRRGRVGALRELAQRLVGVTEPKLRNLAQVDPARRRDRGVRSRRSASARSGSSARGSRGRRSRGGSRASASRRRRRAPRARAPSRPRPSRRAATRSPPSSWRMQRRESRAPRSRARPPPLSPVARAEPRTPRRRCAARGEANVRATASRRRGTPRAGTRRGSSSARPRVAEDARAARGAGRRRPPRRARRGSPRRPRRAAGTGSRCRTPCAGTSGPPTGCRTRAAGRRRAGRPLRSRGRGEAPSPPLRADAGFPRSGRAPRARRAGRTRARARSSRARRGRPRT